MERRTPEELIKERTPTIRKFHIPLPLMFFSHYFYGGFFSSAHSLFGLREVQQPLFMSLFSQLDNKSVYLYIFKKKT